MNKLIKYSILYVALSTTTALICWQQLYAEQAAVQPEQVGTAVQEEPVTPPEPPPEPKKQPKWSRDEVIRATSKQQYAPNVPPLKKMHYFKTAEAINAGGNFALTDKIAEWDQNVKEIEATLQEIDAVRTKFNKPFEQKKAINEDIKGIQIDIDKLDPADITQFTKLTSEKQSLELERNELENTIEKEMMPQLEPLKGKYNKLEKKLFKLFEQIAKEK